VADAGPAEARQGEQSSDILTTSAAGPAAVRGGFMRSGGYAAGILLGLISAPLMIRHLGVILYGRYVIVLSLVTLTAGLTESGLNAIALRELAADRGKDRARALGELLSLRIVLTTVGIAAALLFGLAVGYAEVIELGILITSAALMMQVLESLLATVLQSELRFGWATSMDLLRPALSAILLIAGALLNAPLIWFFWAGIPGALIGLLGTTFLVRRTVRVRPALSPRRWRRLLGETLPFGVTVAINVLYFRLAIVVMSVIATKLQAGYFATSFRVTEILIGIPAVAVAAGFPIVARAAHTDRERLRYASQKLTEVCVVLGIGMALCVALGAAFAMHVLGGAKVAPAAPVLRIQGLALIATWISAAIGFTLLALKRYRILLLANALALALAVVLVFTLVPAYGAKGGAIATVAAETAASIALMIGLRREMRLSLLAIPIAALCGGLALFVGLAIPAGSLVSMLAGALVYSLLVLISGVLPRELLEGVRSFAATLLPQRSSSRT
jgi:O-antigen/teichoic acid export membrane protein